jgi:hypothetical protein
MNCPKCTAPIPPQNTNISTDIGQCPECNFIFRISEHVGEKALPADLSNFDITDPPKGAWIEQHETDVQLGSTTRSVAAFFLFPFMCIWSGGSLGGIYGSQIINGEFDLVMSLFGIPFLLGSILFWGITLMAIVGKVVVSINSYELKVFTGVGKIGRTQRIDLDKIDHVTEQTTRGSKGSSTTTILLEGQRNLSFGSGLSLDRRKFLLKSLQKIVHDKNNGIDFIHQDLSQHLID